MVGLLGSIALIAQRSVAPPVIEVYKTPTCGCCGKWVEHLRAEGFEVRVSDMDDLSAVKASNRIPENLQSCHTGKVGNYVVEGHVPAQDIRKLLAERPPVAGIAVPGMPIGSPGMEVQGVKPQAYDVIAFDSQGTRRVFASHTKSPSCPATAGLGTCKEQGLAEFRKPFVFPVRLVSPYESTSGPAESRTLRTTG
jgi:hypothetical protein